MLKQQINELQVKSAESAFETKELHRQLAENNRKFAESAHERKELQGLLAEQWRTQPANSRVF